MTGPAAQTTGDGRLVAANTVGLVLGHGASQGLQAVSAIVLAGHLGPDGFGAMNIGLTATIMAQTIGSFGLPLFLLREVAAAPERAWPLTDASVAARAWFTAVIVVPAIIGVLLLMPRGLSVPITLYLLAALAMAADVTHLFDTGGVARYQGYLTLFRWLTYVALLVAGFRLEPPLTGAAIVAACYLGSTILYAAAQWLVAMRLRPRAAAPNFRVDRSMLRAAKPFFVSNIAANVYVRSDVLLIGLFAGVTLVGQYTAAYQLVFAAWGVMTLFHRAQFPVLCRRAADPAALRQWIERMLAIGVASSLCLCLAAFFWAPWVIATLYGPSYQAAVLPFRILLGQLFFVGSFFALRHGLIALGLDRAYRDASVAAAALNLLPNLVLIPMFGIVGAAATTVLAEIGGLAWTVRALAGRLRLAYRSVLTPQFAAAGAAALVIGALAGGTRPSPTSVAVVSAYGSLALVFAIRQRAS